MQNRIWSLIPVLTLLGGCITSRPALAPKVTVKDYPPLGEEHTAELGDTILDKGRIFELPALDLKNEVHWGDGFLVKKLTVAPGILTAQEEDRAYTYYFSPQFTIYETLRGVMPARGGLMISKTNENRIFVFASGMAAGGSPKPAAIFSRTTAFAQGQPSFRQELIYDGRNGNQVKFLYREFSGDLIRSAFNQQAEYDLTESKEIGFKGARIEVIEASNTQIKYKVLKSFPDAR